MSILAGVWQFAQPSAQPVSRDTVSMMIDAQGATTFNRALTMSGQVCLGQTVMPNSYVEAANSYFGQRSPGEILIAVDARIDNRVELLDELALSRVSSIDDHGLFFLAYERWREGLVDHVLGDFAAIVWNAEQQTITLFRDPTGQRPLHYHRGPGFIAIASMPQGLLRLDKVSTELNPAQLSRFLHGATQQGPETYYEDIARVEPAQIVRLTQNGVAASIYWNIPTREIRYRRSEDYVSAFREQLDRATHARLRCSEAVVATQLSAGLDSGAVASTAARLLQNSGKVIAVTSAPHVGFVGPVPPGRIADESGLAALLAEQYSNIEHVVVRSGNRSPLSSLEDDARLFGQPVGLPCNNVWWRAANGEARARGATVMLTGEMGNLTISAGGLGVLSDLVRTGRLITWLREIIALEKGETRWRGLMAASFAPWMPRGLWRTLTRLSASGPVSTGTGLGRVPSDLPASGAAIGIPHATQSEREFRWSLLRAIDPGNFRKGAWLKWGIDERDPTADRRLVEFCFSLPPSQLVGEGKTRYLARRGLADRVPPAILEGPRGYQYADWYEKLSQADLASFAARVAAGPGASIINFDEVDRLIDNWPPGSWASSQTIATYRIGLLRALAAGAFALNTGA